MLTLRLPLGRWLLCVLVVGVVTWPVKWVWPEAWGWVILFGAVMLNQTLARRAK